MCYLLTTELSAPLLLWYAVGGILILYGESEPPFGTIVAPDVPARRATACAVK